MSRFLTVQEVATLLACSADFVRSHQKEMGARRLGKTRLIRIPEEGVEKFARALGGVVLFPPLPGALQRFQDAKKALEREVREAAMAGERR